MLGPEALPAIDDLFAHIGHEVLAVVGLEDEPAIWGKAKQSADADHWLTGYCDELQSLKNMGVYKLILCSTILQDHKIQKSWPIFKIKRNECGDTDTQQINVKTVFLYGLLPDDEVQYMEQLKDFEEIVKED
ncbi:uncharacterized protein BT62DRAFT_924198 [Guyanagaster necrorhizus]|uniref:Uncharacterized protein n=1 Tax=Guyanagaster necrorhizus TaxID=856835 RepID=A0A9P7VHU6_9AGAR|nr:uncharacterized protein BT62DRAFT_924198 [Guyanagaster necrorhizus MCA 3950]KAG7440204.1 hypothetical protein BT62DRAFT_924198 [Guyanagaster necrorhizus MCA 3950]